MVSTPAGSTNQLGALWSSCLSLTVSDFYRGGGSAQTKVLESFYTPITTFFFVPSVYAVDDTKLACSVLSFKACGHSVEWLIKGAEGQVSQDGCSAQLTFTTPLTNHHGCFTCRVNDSSNVALYYFGPPSCEGAGECLVRCGGSASSLSRESDRREELI